ncbi:hypothetical protein LCGC14_1919590 [marine sediment metagenome]|uniref:Uncharacterized protein n=1 Tax=marine sediment metagenome TaxID=412755 RepID=A0A0F9FRY6_9ZZZZ
MSEYTEGPWTIETPCGFPYSGLYVVPVARKDFPCYITQIRQLREREESEANARLIAAAPDLYKACEKNRMYLAKLKDMGRLHADGIMALEKTNAALAEAEE